MSISQMALLVVMAMAMVMVVVVVVVEGGVSLYATGRANGNIHQIHHPCECVVC